MTVDELVERLAGRRNGTGYQARCPAHDDRQASLSIGEGDGGNVLLHCHAGCELDTILRELKLDRRDLFPYKRASRSARPKVIAEYIYRNADGAEAYRVCRRDDKTFYIAPKGIRPTERVPYHLPDVFAAIEAGAVVFIVEGEKDVDRIRAAGGNATCNPLGAGKWLEHFGKLFTGAHVCIIPDNDEPGRAHAADIARNLAPYAASIITLELDVPDKGDVSDWIAAGHTFDELGELYQEALENPAPEPVHTEQKHAAPLIIDDPTPAELFDSGRLIVERLARYITQDLTTAKGHDGRIYAYMAGVYRPCEDELRYATHKALRDRAKAAHVDEVIRYLRDMHLSRLPETPDPAYINTPNCAVWWASASHVTHSPRLLSTVQIATEWHPDATCPGIDRFLHDVLADDSIEFIYEAIGYTLHTGNPLRKALMLLGHGANGKSVLLNIITALIGERNVSHIPLQTLAENRFAASGVYLKLANICGDLDARAVKRSDQFKQLTGGDRMRGERKYEHEFYFRPFCLPIFSANEPPISSDQTNAWFDRWVIIPFERRFDAANADPHLTRKLTTKAELEGLLVRAVHGLNTLMRRGHFDLPGTVVDAGAVYRDRLDSVRGFVDEECVLHVDKWVWRTELYDNYRQWCTATGRFPVSAANFYDRLLREWPGQIEHRKTGGARRLAGIGMSSATDL